MIDGNNRFGFVGVVVLTCQTDAVLDGVRPIGGGETVVIIIEVGGVVIEPHGTVVIVLIEPALVVSYREAMMDEDLMVGITASHLEAVPVSLTRIFSQSDGDGLSVPIGHLRTHLAVEPGLVDTCRARVGTHIIVRTPVFETDTILNDGVRGADALEEIPTVVGVTPCAASDIVVSGAGELLVRKAIRVSSEVSGSTGHCLVVEVMVRIDILDDVVASYFHLTACIA